MLQLIHKTFEYRIWLHIVERFEIQLNVRRLLLCVSVGSHKAEFYYKYVYIHAEIGFYAPH